MSAVRFLYTNHRGETRWRTVAPIGLWFGSTDWHPVPQWLLQARDIEKDEIRDFAMCHVKQWEAAE